MESKSIKIVTVIGARPQFIKAAALSHALKEKTHFEEVIVHTGQHYDSNMSDIFFKQLNLPEPKYKLNCGSLGHGAMTGLALKEIETILVNEKPNILLVYGDTNATLAGALAASKLHIPIIHIESGLRSFDPLMPEEINRVLTDSVSSILCVPSQTGIENLKREGFPRYNTQEVINTGDIQHDSTILFSNLNLQVNNELEEIIEDCKQTQYLVLTMHRPSNVDEKKKLAKIGELLKKISEKYRIILPIHPRTRQRIKDFELNFNFLDIIEPVGYTDMLNLIKNSSGVITDSGGLQKESYYLKKNTVVLRNSTEWIELISNNSSILANEGSSPEKLILHLQKPVNNSTLNTYGDGKSSQKIIEAIENFFA